TVMPILLAIGIAQHSGLLAAAIRKLFGTSPAWMLPYVVGFVGVVASIMADSAFVVIPPLAALCSRLPAGIPSRACWADSPPPGRATPPTSSPLRWTPCSRASPPP